MEPHNSNIIVSMISLSSLLLFLSAEAAGVAPEQKSKLSAHSIAEITMSDIKASPQVEEVCAITENPRLCEKTMTARGVENDASPKSVLMKHMQTSADAAALAQKDCLAASTEIGKKDKILAKCYHDCSDMYTKAGQDLAEAMKLCTGGDMEKTEFMVDSAMSYFESCDDVFEEAQATSPMKETNDFLCRLSTNGISIARSIKTAGKA